MNFERLSKSRRIDNNNNNNNVFLPGCKFKFLCDNVVIFMQMFIYVIV